MTESLVPEIYKPERCQPSTRLAANVSMGYFGDGRTKRSDVDEEALQEKAQELRSLKNQHRDAENDVQRLRLAVANVNMDMSKTQYELAAANVNICDLQKDIQTLIHNVALLENELRRTELSRAASEHTRMMYRKKMEQYGRAQSSRQSRMHLSQELKELQQEVEQLEVKKRLLSDERKQVADKLQETDSLKKRLQKLNEDKQMWLQKIDQLTRAKQGVSQNCHQMKKRNQAKLLCLKRQVHEVKSKNARWIEESIYLKKLIEDLKQSSSKDVLH